PAGFGSPRNTTRLEQAAADVEAGGPAWAVLAGREADAGASALALRFLGAVHRLVLEGHAPALARHYPSAGGEAGLDGAWAAFRDTLEQHRDTLRVLVTSPVQTNEVGRPAALLGGLLLGAPGAGRGRRLRRARVARGAPRRAGPGCGERRLPFHRDAVPERGRPATRGERARRGRGPGDRPRATRVASHGARRRAGRGASHAVARRERAADRERGIPRPAGALARTLS